MPLPVSDEELADAVIQNVDQGAYPESEHVVLSELSGSALPKLLQSLNESREEVKKQVRNLSRDAAPDVDEWIAQARQVQADIERSKAMARDIVQEKETNKAHGAAVEDAAGKVRLLQSELAFNEVLGHTLEQARSIKSTLDKAFADARSGRLIEAIGKLEHAVDAATDLSRFENSRFTALLHERIAQLGAALLETARGHWHRLVATDSSQRKITIDQQSTDEASMSLDTVAAALDRLDSLEDTVERFCWSFDNLILRPRLSSCNTSDAVMIVVKGDEISIARATTAPTTASTVDDMKSAVRFLQDRLPSSVTVLVSEALSPKMTQSLIDSWLRPSIPLDLDGIGDFRDALSLVADLNDFMQGQHWTGASVLSEWIEDVPRHWLSRRKNAALAAARSTFAKALQVRKVVERIETRTVARDDALRGAQESQNSTTSPYPEPQSTQQEDDWGAAWGDEEDPAAENGDEDEDASAWDVEDDGAADETPAPGPVVAPEESSANSGEDDWGAWGDGDDDQADEEPPSSPGRRKAAAKTNGAVTPPPEVHETTLREDYTITGIPDALLDLISTLLSDAETLSQPPYSNSPMAVAATGLYSIPSLVIALYRATAPTTYALDPSANMLIHNDSTRLSETLTHLVAATRSPRLRLGPDLGLLSALARRAHALELHTQRTILRDHLSAAHAFAHCTTPPFASACGAAVAAAVAHVRDLDSRWRAVLAPSLRLRTLGHLVDVVARAFVLDVADLSDIAEDESVRLKALGDDVAALADLFPARSGVAAFVPTWRRLRCLSEVLGASLMEIRAMWNEGDLSVQFDVEEVVDLIEALFAPSEYRRAAIADVRRRG